MSTRDSNQKVRDRKGSQRKSQRGGGGKDGTTAKNSGGKPSGGGGGASWEQQQAPNWDAQLAAAEKTNSNPYSNSAIMEVLHNIGENLKEHLQDLEVVTQNMHVLAADIKDARDQNELNATLKRMHEQNEMSRKYAQRVKSAVQDLQDLLDKRRSALTKTEADFGDRALKEHSRRFHAAIKNMLSAQHAFDEVTTKKVEQHMHQMYPQASPSDVQRMVQERRQKDQQQLQNPMADVEVARQELDQLDEEAQALFELEAAIKETDDMMFYINALVEEQAEQIIDIEDMVYGAQAFVGAGVEQLDESEGYFNSYMIKKICLSCCFWCGLIAAVVVGIILLVIFCGNGGGATEVHLVQSAASFVEEKHTAVRHGLHNSHGRRTSAWLSTL
ncbi:unnamed protein product [Amoebophrya sp. A120]|nr:unnamed protein product [Amoebophrya sp. A120]|eukprot:GSA120T00001861001.1